MFAFLFDGTNTNWVPNFYGKILEPDDDSYLLWRLDIQFDIFNFRKIVFYYFLLYKHEGTLNDIKKLFWFAQRGLI